MDMPRVTLPPAKVARPPTFSLAAVLVVKLEPFNVIVARVQDDFDAHGEERHPDIEAEAALQVRVLKAILAGGSEIVATLPAAMNGPPLGFPGAAPR